LKQSSKIRKRDKRSRTREEEKGAEGWPVENVVPVRPEKRS